MKPVSQSVAEIRNCEDRTVSPAIPRMRCGFRNAMESTRRPTLEVAATTQQPIISNCCAGGGGTTLERSGGGTTTTGQTTSTMIRALEDMAGLTCGCNAVYSAYTPRELVHIRL